MKPLSLTLFWALLSALLWSEESFSLLVYNVENLFDADGVALFEDYREEETPNPQPYGPRKLLTKLDNIARVLSAVDDGAGPDIAVFSELEFDRTPGGEPPDYSALAARYAELTVEDMLVEELDGEIRDLPVEFLLWKHFMEMGMGDYFFTIQAARPITEEVEAHTNAVFSRFPITEVRSHALVDARDILEVTLEVHGHPLVIFANHWKSGASNVEREPIRIQNAEVLRGRIDALLAEDRLADFIVAGDLNSNYNQNFTLNLEKTGIRNVLLSQGDELAIRFRDPPPLYNLWFELPPERRFAEVWRGTYSTLMHILLPAGLYDRSGIQYVDGSFRQVILPGVNARPPGMHPIRWYFAGEAGGGFSDHLPLLAEFRVVENPMPGFMELRNPSRTAEGSRVRFRPPEGPAGINTTRRVRELRGLSPEELAEYYGEAFQVTGRLISRDPLQVRTVGRTYDLYVPDREKFARLQGMEMNSRIRFIGVLGEYRGRVQLVME